MFNANLLVTTIRIKWSLLSIQQKEVYIRFIWKSKILLESLLLTANFRNFYRCGEEIHLVNVSKISTMTIRRYIFLEQILVLFMKCYTNPSYRDLFANSGGRCPDSGGLPWFSKVQGILPRNQCAGQNAKSPDFSCCTNSFKFLLLQCNSWSASSTILCSKSVLTELVYNEKFLPSHRRKITWLDESLSNTAISP